MHNQKEGNTGIGFDQVSYSPVLCSNSSIDNQGDRAWEAEAREGLTFDTNLASMHSYLGGLGGIRTSTSMCSLLLRSLEGFFLINVGSY